MIKNKFFIFLFVFFISVVSVFGQNRKKLEIQRKQLKKEIKQVNRLLFYQKKKAKNVLEDLKDISQKINVRNRLIKTINLESEILLKAIKTSQKKLAKLNKELVALKKDYAAIIFKSYKSRSKQSKSIFLLSSQNFYQAYKRLEYIKQYTDFRKKQAKEIVLQTSLVKKINDSLRYQKQVKDTLILIEKEQKTKIEIDKKRKQKLVSIIKKKERKYRRYLQKKISEDKKIATKIDRIIRNAIAKSNKKVKHRPKSTKKSEFILSPKTKKLATEFRRNKGKLPWPVKGGLITRRFGIQPHPTIKGITINSPGLHINTRRGAFAKCIFNGRVLAIQLTSQGRKNVLVQHGNYISAYNNLENSLVTAGDNVVTGQKIGKIFTDKVSGKTELIFVLFKNTTRLNPSSWILKR